MRSFLAAGLLITLCASADAATARHARHVVVPAGHEYAVPGWGYEAVRPPVRYRHAELRRSLEVWRRHGVIRNGY